VTNLENRERGEACLASRYSSEDLFNPFIISHSRRSNLLEEKFRELNRMYFLGKLPEYTVLLCSKPKSFGHEVAGYCVSKDRKILIRDGLGPKSTLQTLMHEMIHATLTEFGAKGRRRVHGTLFLKELKRLRNLGAPLSPLDLDRNRARKTRMATKGNVKNLIREARIVERLPRESVPKFLEMQLALPFTAIDQEMEVKPIIQEIYRANGSHIKLP
jgi:hypothetical protein